jgi:hypothetical protein
LCAQNEKRLDDDDDDDDGGGGGSGMQPLMDFYADTMLRLFTADVIILHCVTDSHASK